MQNIITIGAYLVVFLGIVLVTTIWVRKNHPMLKDDTQAESCQSREEASDRPSRS